MIHGASHESGRRAGTENVISIVGMGAAASLALSCLEKVLLLTKFHFHPFIFPTKCVYLKLEN